MMKLAVSKRKYRNAVRRLARSLSFPAPGRGEEPRWGFHTEYFERRKKTATKASRRSS